MSLEGLLSGAHTFHVPDYQRPYSWTITEAEQLLDDLNLAIEETPDPDAPDEGYFFGSVLLMERGPAEGTARDIVDGQQRLVTLTILLAVLRDLSAARGNSLARLIDPLLWVDADRPAPALPRIALNGATAAFLREHVQDAGASELMPDEDRLAGGEAQIIAVREYLAEALLALDEKELARLARYVAATCYFSVVTTRSIDRAHRIFSVLNNRGRPLARNDILKVQILGGIAPAERGQYVDIWARIEARLGNDFEQLFSHIRAIEGRNRGRVIGSIRDLVADCGGAERFCLDVLEPYARIYEALQVRQVPVPAGQEAIARYLGYLGWLGSADWMPAAMLFWRRVDGDAKELEPFLRRLDRLAYCLRLLGIGADKRLARFNAVVAAVRRGTIDNPDSPLELSRDELRNIQYNLRSLHSRSQLTCKLVLLRLNDEIAGGPQNVSPGDYTVEHVLPQKPNRNSQWHKWFPKADERETAMQSLGNLVLVTRSENDRARNGELLKKLDVYFADGGARALAITRELKGISEWQGSHIAQREERMLAMIQKLWGLEPARGQGPNGQGDGASPPVRRRVRRKDAG